MKEDNKTGLDISSLAPYQPRQFVPADAVLTSKEQIESLLRQLLERPIQSSGELEQWILDRSELEAAADQHRSILYIRMTCQTDDPARAQAYQDFVEMIEPVLKILSDELDRKMIEAVDALSFESERYQLYFRKVRSNIELFRQENVPLQTEESLLSQQYQKVTGAMSVEFEGTEYPISQMRKFLLQTDRDIRQRAYKAVSKRYLQDSEPLNNIFDKMVLLRHQIAENAGHENYRDYKFTEYHRFDYSPQNCKAFHAAAEKHLVPLQQIIHQRRAEQMGIEYLYPCDLHVDPLGRQPLKPFDTMQGFVTDLHRMFDQLDPQFGDYFKVMTDNGLLDLESRKGKAPGGYQSTLYESRKPFIFGNTIGTNGDLRLMTHEGGHAFHAMACAHDPLVDYRHGPIEFCEVASMSMELLSAVHLDVFYNDTEQKRWWRDQLEKIVSTLIQVAQFDAFQHWIYENPVHTVRQRNQQWLQLSQRFDSGIVDWTGQEEARALMWHRVLHFFQVPFYYIEYGIAQLGALGIWLQSRQNLAEAISNYKKALALGGSRPLPELFAAAGLEFDFSEKTIQPLARILQDEWQKLASN